TTHGRPFIRRHFDEIKSRLTRDIECLFRGDYANHLSVLIHHPNRAETDLLIQPIGNVDSFSLSCSNLRTAPPLMAGSQHVTFICVFPEGQELSELGVDRLNGGQLVL